MCQDPEAADTVPGMIQEASEIGTEQVRGRGAEGI